MRTKPTRFNKRPRVITNQAISGENFRLIDNQGKQIGLLSRQQAFDYAQQNGVDLILITRNIDPPVVKAIELNKYYYQEEKKLKESKKGQKKSQTKDITFGIFIGENDFNRLLEKGREFITEGNQVRIKVVLRGREFMKKDRAFEMINRFITNVGEVNVSTPPRQLGKIIIAVISRKK